jgi:hypothetical protein
MFSINLNGRIGSSSTDGAPDPLPTSERSISTHFLRFCLLAFAYTRRSFSFALLLIIFSELLAPGRPIRALASDTPVTVGWGSNQSSAVRFKAREQMLRACCEPLRAMLRAGCVQHQNISRPPPLLLSCCDHVATMLRPCCDSCCVQHPTSGALLLDTTPTSYVCNIETQHP